LVAKFRRRVGHNLLVWRAVDMNCGGGDEKLVGINATFVKDNAMRTVQRGLTRYVQSPQFLPVKMVRYSKQCPSFRILSRNGQLLRKPKVCPPRSWIGNPPSYTEGTATEDGRKPFHPRSKIGLRY